MVNLLTSSAVVRGLELQSANFTKDYKIGICWVPSGQLQVDIIASRVLYLTS